MTDPTEINEVTVAGRLLKTRGITDGQIVALYRIYEAAQMPNVSPLTLVREMSKAQNILLAAILDEEERAFADEQLMQGNVTLIELMKQVFTPAAEEPVAPVRRPRGRPRKNV